MNKLAGIVIYEQSSMRWVIHLIFGS